MSGPFIAYIRGCYVAWSPTLQQQFRQRFPSSPCVLVKIGRARDILARLENLNGRQSRLSRGRYAVDPDGYAHVRDWQLWRLTNIDTHGERVTAEGRFQAAHSALASWLRDDIHDVVSNRHFSPQSEELFVARPSVIVAQFPMLIAEGPMEQSSLMGGVSTYPVAASAALG